MLLLIGIFIGLCSFAIVTAGLLAYIRNNEKPENKWFLALSVCLGLWVPINYLDSNIALSHFLGHTLVVADFALGLFIGWTLLQFVTLLTTEIPNIKARTAFFRTANFQIASFVVNVALIAMVLTGMIFTTNASDGIAVVVPHTYFPLYVAALGGYFLAALSALVAGYFQGNQAYKRRLSLIVAGFVVGIVANLLTNLLFPNVFSQRSIIQALNSIGYLGIFFLAYCIYMAITTRKLFNIRMVIARSLVYAVLVGLIVVFYSAAILLAGYVLSGEVQLDARTLVISLILTIFIAITFQFVRNYVSRATNRLLYQDAYEPQDALNALTNITTSTTDLERVVRLSKDLIEHTLKATYCSFILVDKKGKITHVSNDVTGEHAVLKQLSRYIPRSHQPVITELLSEEDRKYTLLRSLSAEMVFPLYAGEGVIGIVVLGAKHNGKDYVQGDIKFLGIAASSLSVAIQNALRFEEIERFNETLQQKVNDATRQLREANKRLKQLNESKDDFIGMASHQLRTPLSSTKGYLSLVIDGDAGPVNDTQKQLLQQAFSSAQKMVYLIADLLNVSRLKTGKFLVERTQTNLARMISDEMGQLKEEARNRGVDLTYEPPKHFPVLPLDETKTRQVIMNFLDNAIYYTPSGGHIRAELKELPKSIEFRVVDDGIGVPKAEQHHLFSKFYRAKNAQRARPDGTGLGLYMAKKVVIAQGGVIIFSSKEGQGSTFGFSFPKDLPAKDTVPTLVTD